MRSAYHRAWLYNLAVIKETKRWLKGGLITREQAQAIHAAYPSEFYHPNIVIRILLFVASLLAISGITGLLALGFSGVDSSAIWFLCLLYGIISFFILDILFIRENKHFKSGVNEAILYHACLFTLIGLSGMADFENEHLTLISCCLVFVFAAYRYLDLVCTCAFFVSLTAFIFFEFYMMGDIWQQIIPFVMIIVFSLLYWRCRKLRHNSQNLEWENNIVLLEALSLLVIYAAGNYLVVRELSIEMMGLALEDGEDIPFAIVFYLLTVLIPIAYLYFGIKRKDVILIRVSLVVIAFSVFTFKYYYGFGHPEITLTAAGAILIVISIALLNYLKVMKNGYTRENLLEEKWGNANIEAFLVAQTMGGNQVTPEENYSGGGGEFGGGGATGRF